METTKSFRDLIWVDPGRVGGIPCFYGTRVPVGHLFDYLAGGYTAQEFARKFELPLEQVLGVLAASEEGLAGEIQKAA